MDKLILDYDLPLRVDYREKEQAKKMGAKPMYKENGGGFKCWYIPAGKDVMPLRPWWPDELLAQHSGGQEQGEPDIQGIRLRDVMGTVKKSLEKGFPSPIWIQAEVVNASGGTHMYLELADYDGNGAEQAKARAMIWASDLGMVRKFEQETGMSLSKSGLKILFSAYVEFSPRYGFSLRVVRIDSRFTVGDMEAKLVAMRAALKSEGNFDRNRHLSRPREFTRVAVIAPDGAAGLGDFMTQANALQEHDLCHFDVFHAVFQGDRVISTLVSALEMVEMAMQRGTQYDALVIIRGGGDKAGLYSLNELEIARRVCTYALPVIVGIGHERDSTLLDEVANLRCPTPSLVISYICGQIMHNARQARQQHTLLKQACGEALAKAKMDCERLKGEMNAGVNYQLSKAREEVERLHDNTRHEARFLIVQAKDHADSLHRIVRQEARHAIGLAKGSIRELMSQVVYVDPKETVKRGYALVRNEAGQVVGDAQQLSVGEQIVIDMRDGSRTAQLID